MVIGTVFCQQDRLPIQLVVCAYARVWPSFPSSIGMSSAPITDQRSFSPTDVSARLLPSVVFRRSKELCSLPLDNQGLEFMQTIASCRGCFEVKA